MPPKVDYRLTELGATSGEAMIVIDQLVIEHFHEMADAKDRYQRRERGQKLSSLSRPEAPVTIE